MAFKKRMRLLSFLWPYKRYVTVIAFSMICFSFLQVASLTTLVPVVDKILVEEGQSKAFFDIDPATPPTSRLDRAKLWVNDHGSQLPPQVVLRWVGLFLLIMIFLKGIFGFLKNYFIARLGQKVIMNIRNQVYAHMQYLSVQYFTTIKTGDVISRFTNDMGLIQAGVTKGICEAVFQPLQIIFYGTVLFFCQPKLAVISILLVAVCIRPIIVIGRTMKKIGRAWQEQLGGLASVLQETVTGIRIVKAFAMEKYEIAKFKRENRQVFKTVMRFEKRKELLPPLMELVGAVGVVVILIFGGEMVLEGDLTKGQFLLFVIALVSVLNPFKKLGKINSVIQMMRAASDRIYKILDEMPDIRNRPGAIQKSTFIEKLEFRDVSFAYEPSRCIVNQISFSVSRGEIVAIVGASGEGKSTLLNLVPRFYDVTGGAILIDGIDLRDLEIMSLRQTIGMVTQETILFNDTIQNNIIYGRQTWKPEELEQAARQANAHEFITGFPNGYQSVIGERGVKLSGGQKQRLAIARALMKNPPILILDEATSSLDSQSERLVQDAIDLLMKGRTVIAVAHRLSTIIHADKIIVLDQGRIIAEGPHDKLLLRSPAYKKMYDLQFQGF